MLVWSTDALAQVCQDMYSTYVDFITAQASFLLSQKVLQPQQLSESYLATISGKCTLNKADLTMQTDSVSEPCDSNGLRTTRQRVSKLIWTCKVPEAGHLLNLLHLLILFIVLPMCLPPEATQIQLDVKCSPFLSMQPRTLFHPNKTLCLHFWEGVTWMTTLHVPSSAA